MALKKGFNNIPGQNASLSNLIKYLTLTGCHFEQSRRSQLQIAFLLPCHFKQGASQNELTIQNFKLPQNGYRLKWQDKEKEKPLCNLQVSTSAFSKMAASQNHFWPGML